jgi:hypothetical protein
VRERNSQSSGIGIVTDGNLREHLSYTDVWFGNILVSTNRLNAHMAADLNSVRNQQMVVGKL